MRRYVRTLRWLALAAGLFMMLWSCVSHPLTQPTPRVAQETDAEVTIVPTRHLDLVFMVDNSPSMGPKQAKMKAQFPKLIDALRDPNDGSLPDLRIAILDSDLGAGLSDRACGSTINQGDKGVFQMRGADALGIDPSARWLELTKGQPVNFTGDVSTVFGQLASNVGVQGCGYEHQLGAVEWAFYLKDNASQRDFLRPEAYLGIVILTDEDDCSAPADTAMYDDQSLKTESGSLRCATRGHVCDGVKLAFPTQAAVSVPYAACRARTDASCDDGAVDTSVATSCNPLTSIDELALAVKEVKGKENSDRVFVAAIYGTPRAGDTSTPSYKIDMVHDPRYPNDPNARVWDYWPICYDPDYPPSASGYDQAALDHGATGGLRIDAFLSQFPESHRRAYSICESDFGPAMKGIGDALSVLMGNLCVPYKLVDTSDAPGVQADCRVAYKIPHTQKAQDGSWVTTWNESPDSLPDCATNKRSPPCWEVIRGDANGSDAEKTAAQRCPAKGSAPSQMVNVLRPPNDGLPEGTKAVMQCLTCVQLPDGMDPGKACDY